jgi:glycosyltransferase involved in cell wall biosynthesis
MDTLHMRKIEICIPAFNEAEIIVPTLEAVLATCEKLQDKDVVVTVVDNNSTDDTATLVKTHKDPRVRVMHESVQGKGLAVKAAAKHSTADLFIYIDADLSATPDNIGTMLEQIELGADIVVGSRLTDTTLVNRSFWRTLVSRAFVLYADTVVPVGVSDSQCGLKVMRQEGREILAECIHNGWFFDREFLAKAEKRSLHIVEVPITWNEFVYPNRKSKLRVVKDGLRSLYELLQIRSSVKKYK